MIRLGCWLAALAVYAVLWHECGENPLVFCYRIGWNTFTSKRACALVPVRVSLRTSAACSKPSVIFSKRSMMSKD
jgi:hypothetical protein